MKDCNEKYLDVLVYIFETIQTSEEQPYLRQQIRKQFSDRGGVGDQFLTSMLRLGFLKKENQSKYSWNHNLCSRPSEDLANLIKREMNQYNGVVMLQKSIAIAAEQQLIKANKLLQLSTNKVN